jgi:hypothetical protein
MIDNFEIIKPMLKFESEDDFYFIQILQRKKDNPGRVNGSSNSSRLVKAYYIDSIDHLDELKDEMIFFANHFNARVGLNLNKRSYEKTAFNTLKKVAEVMHNKDFKMVKRAWNTSCGVHNGGDKIWLLDIDTPDMNYVNGVNEFISGIFPGGDKTLGLIPSKSGYHLITKGFDLRDFTSKYPEIEIHKNNPTNLYIP